MNFHLVSGDLEDLTGYAMFYFNLDSQLGKYYAGFGFDTKKVMLENINFNNYVFNQFFDEFPQEIIGITTLFNNYEIIEDIVQNSGWDVFLANEVCSVKSKNDLMRLDRELLKNLKNYQYVYNSGDLFSYNEMKESFLKLPEPTEENMKDIYRNC